jgi:hypothetical protein
VPAASLRQLRSALPQRSKFARSGALKVQVLNSRSLRSRERRFASCWGRPFCLAPNGCWPAVSRKCPLSRLVTSRHCPPLWDGSRPPGLESGALAFADGAAGGEHGRDEFGAADGAGVEGVVGFGGGGLSFGQVGFAERVGGEPFLADGVAEAFVQTLLGLSESSRLATSVRMAMPASRERPRDQLPIEWAASRSGRTLDVATGAYRGWVIIGVPGQAPSGRCSGRAARSCSVVRGGGRCSSGLLTGRGG